MQYKNREIQEAIEVRLEDATTRQHIIKGIHSDLQSNPNRNISELLEEIMVKTMRYRRRSLITQQEYRDRIRVIEMFYFNR